MKRQASQADAEGAMMTSFDSIMYFPDPSLSAANGTAWRARSGQTTSVVDIRMELSDFPPGPAWDVRPSISV
jgi:hypothetical protein